jgi:hypothetical protein
MPHPARAGLWELFLSRENLAGRFDASSGTPVPRASTGCVLRSSGHGCTSTGRPSGRSSTRAPTVWTGSRKGYWRIAGSAVLNRGLPNVYWADLGLKGFSDPYRRFRDATRTAGCGGPACPVVWEGPG